MFFIIGIVIVFGSVLGGYLPHGSFDILVQPLELLIIGGAATGAFIISNPGPNMKRCLSHMSRVFKGMPHNKDSYLDLLTLLYKMFRLARTKGMLALESHIDEPHESELFQDHPNFLANHHAVEFLCDYFRLVTMGSDNVSEIEDLMNLELEVHHAEAHAAYGAVNTVGEGMPAFGIVAAVLGVIITMASITEPPEVLGQLVGMALVGTFLGILLAYGVVMPVSKNMEAWANSESKYLECIKAGVLAHLQGSAPAISIEFARKSLFSQDRPTFEELEDAVST
jgi:chemotaxis protein MotA